MPPVANPMTAREAWEIVKVGEPIDAFPWVENAAIARYARACAIVEALVAAHEDMSEMPDDDVTGAVVHVRALERGEGESK